MIGRRAVQRAATIEAGMATRKAVEGAAVQAAAAGEALARRVLPEAVQAAVVDPDEVKAVATLDEVVASLSVSGRDWRLLLDPREKALVVAAFIDRFREQGVIIRKPPSLYVGMIDQMAAQTPEMLDRPFPGILQVMAVIEYDFDNGEDKDAMARRILDPEAFTRNKQRLFAP